MSVQQSLQMTSSKSLVRSSLTPPAPEVESEISTSHIIEEIKQRKLGVYAGESWLKFVLNEYSYQNLQHQLQKASLWDFFDNRVRYDYFPSAKLFVLRMSGILHDSLQYFVMLDIMAQLSTIAHGEGPSAEFAGKVDQMGSAKIKFKDTQYGPHYPDASFQHREAYFPGVIVEVAHSQKAKDLPSLADAYILGSDADIRVVIGINVRYKKSKKASVSVWRPCIGLNDVGEDELFVVQTITDQIFRDDAGNFVSSPEACVKLQLEDFGTEAFAAKFPDLTQIITISGEKLFTFLEESEAKLKRNEQDEGLRRATKPWVRKRPRATTPPEQLSPEREKGFTKQEENKEGKAIKDDGSYKGNSFEGE